MTCEKCKEKDTEIAKRDRIISAMCNGISRIVNERDLDETTEDALYALLEINHKAPWQDRSPEAPEIIATDTKEYEMTGGGKARITVSIIKTPEAPAREKEECIIMPSCGNCPLAGTDACPYPDDNIDVCDKHPQEKSETPVAPESREHGPNRCRECIDWNVSVNSAPCSRCGGYPGYPLFRPKPSKSEGGK